MNPPAEQAHATAPSSSPQPSPPRFDAAFSNPSNCFFYHTIDLSTATLTSNVLGPNLSTTFSHPRAASVVPPATLLAKLTNKTTGFLALATTPRTVLAWAESGHGHSPQGDLLAAGPTILPNGLWARRVISLASRMGLRLGHPYDRLAHGGRAGIFRSSHVEVKLATYAVYALLRMRRLRPPGEPLSLDHLAMLRRHPGPNPHPAFEIYFSKRNCHACADYVARLSSLAGVSITLCWRERLVKMEYRVASMGVPPADRDVVTLDDDDDDISAPLDAVDLTTASSLSAAPILDGLAYCIGQGTRPNAVRAVIHLATMWRRQRRRQRLTPAETIVLV